MESVEVDALLTRIYDWLYRLGLNANLFGFSYLSCAVFLSIRRPERFGTFTDEIYSEIARLYHVGREDVKRSIRRTLFLIWKNQPNFSGDSLRKPPSLERFIFYARSYLEISETNPVKLPELRKETESVI